MSKTIHLSSHFSILDAQFLTCKYCQEYSHCNLAVMIDYIGCPYILPQ